MASDGKWAVRIAPGEPGGPFKMTVKGANEITLDDVWVGDVWVCSGQSNMTAQMPAKAPPGAEGKIRGFVAVGNGPLEWQVPKEFCRIGWTSACAIYEQEKIPVGLIYAAIGGTSITGWIAAPDSDPKKPAEKPAPGGLYADSLLKVQPFAIKGVFWWQGENDATLFNTTQYDQNFPALIRGWRRDWQCGEFPFLYVQLQSLPDADDGYGAQWIRECQRHALSVPKTGMVVTFDITDGNLHPKQEEIAKRMLLPLKAVGYGQKLEWSGPLFDSAVLQGDQILISFTHLDKGLVAKGGKLEGFEIKSAWSEPKGSTATDKWPAFPLPDWSKDRGAGFVPVDARLTPDSKQVVISAKDLKPPLRVRYASKSMARGNLYNTAELPASPFVSDPLAPQTLSWR
jgi:sialate O-acetylesterase